MGHPPAERTITTGDELRRALVAEFLANADAGRHTANDELVNQLGTWQRRHPTNPGQLPATWR